MPIRVAGFTLLELLVVISIIAIASAGVSFAFRDSTQSALERDADRLAALLEAGRTLSRTSGQVLLWRDGGQGFRFEGLNAANLPPAGLQAGTTVEWDASVPNRMLVLGPEPLIEPQGITLRTGDRRLRVATDGLRPFSVQATP